MIKFSINTKSASCEVVLDARIDQLSDFCPHDRVIVITDDTVNALYASSLPYPVISFSPGEPNKTLDTVRALYDQFLELGVDRSSFIVAVGGGLVCDVAGFVASTYMRGIPFGSVPSTLLAQVDAAIGGKNGVNRHGYKNLIGTINQPRFVLCDPQLLKTLPERELKCGFAEIIKHAVIADSEYFNFLNANCFALLSLQTDVLIESIKRSIEIKATIVGQDETEQGLRRLLNFGHTLGHAVEKTTALHHGEAVSVGMIFATILSEKLGLLSDSKVEKIRALIEKFGLPTRQELDQKAIIEAIGKDKKRADETLRFVLLDDIGHAIDREIEQKELELWINDLC